MDRYNEDVSNPNTSDQRLGIREECSTVPGNMNGVGSEPATFECRSL